MSVSQKEEDDRRRRLMLKKLLIIQRLRGMIRYNNYITKNCLVDQEWIYWDSFYLKATDEEMIAYTGFSHDGFKCLAQEFSEHYVVNFGTRKGGRPSRITKKDTVLAMLLHFYSDTATQKSICLAFSIPPSTQSRTMRRAEFALHETLRQMKQAKIRWPSPEEMTRWAALVEAYEPLLKNVMGFIDGKNLRVQKPTNSDLQNAMYNGWLHATLITGVLCFGVDGTIMWGRHNCPGSWNDSEMSTGFREKLTCPRKTPLQMMAVLSDSAFPVSGDMQGRILTPLKDGDIFKVHHTARHGALVMSNAIVGTRQAAEWGMGAVEKPFQRLKMCLPFDPVLRGVRLNNMFKLYNLRVRTTGISQIKNVFKA